MKIKNFLLYTSLIAQLALGPMACTVSRNTVPNTPKNTRKVYVKIAADEEYRIPYVWKVSTNQDLKAASKAFKKQFGIELIVTEFEKWDSEDYETRINRSLDELKREVKLGKNDIVIGFSGQDYSMSRNGYRVPVTGFAEGIGTGNYIILAYGADLKTIVHELGHLWGATHDDYPLSVMCHGSSRATTNFYGKNKEKVMGNKYRDFRIRNKYKNFRKK